MNPDTQCKSGDELLGAYLTTIYRVILNGESEDVRIGHPHPRLDRKTGATCWAIITAFNPGSGRLAESDNRQRHCRLQEIVDATGLSCRPTRHIAADGVWPTEEGLFIPDAEDQWVHEQAHEFGQFGIVHGHRHGLAELWLYGGFSPDNHPHIRVFH